MIMPNRFDPNPYTGKPMYYKDNPDAVKRRDSLRMYVNGKEISKKSPLHKPGKYKSLDDAWSHSEIEKTSEGEVYLIMNPAWPEWIKVGKAAIATDRLSNYQTSSPFRDYIIVKSVKTEDRHATETDLLNKFEAESVERRGEWFKINKEKAIELLAL
jgi:hypothetical protein